MKHNVIPIAKAKGLGVVGMKVFGAGTMYKEVPGFSRRPDQIYREVGSVDLPSHELIEYVLTTPGVDTLIIDIGHIDEDPLKCQLTQNYYASQVRPDAMSDEKRREIEAKTAQVAGERTNFFQLDKIDMTPPRDLKQEAVDGTTKITWQTAYAAEHAISHYEIVLNDNIIGKVAHKPQVLKESPFVFETAETGTFKVYTVDAAGNRA